MAEPSLVADCAVTLHLYYEYCLYWAKGHPSVSPTELTAHYHHHHYHHHHPPSVPNESRVLPQYALALPVQERRGKRISARRCSRMIE